MENPSSPYDFTFILKYKIYLSVVLLSDVNFSYFWRPFPETSNQTIRQKAPLCKKGFQICSLNSMET